MKPTHQMTNFNGEVYLGAVVGNAPRGSVLFLPMCKDGKTWMKEPVCAWGVHVREIDAAHGGGGRSLP